MFCKHQARTVALVQWHSVSTSAMSNSNAYTIGDILNCSSVGLRRLGKRWGMEESAMVPLGSVRFTPTLVALHRNSSSTLNRVSH